MTNNPCNPSNKLRLYCNTCTHHHGETPFLCFHPDYIGRDGDGVSLTAMEQEFVKRMGCANHSGVREYLMRDVIVELERRANASDSGYEHIRMYALYEAIRLIREVVE